MTIRNLDALLSPRSVALIGASARAGSVGNTIATNLAVSSFSGPVHFVNPRHDTLLGRRCHRSVSQLPDAPDLAVIATPPPTVPTLVAELAETGCRAALIITAGIDHAARLRMLAAGRERLMRILGPNTVGLMLPPLGLNASFAHRPALAGDLAFVSQSGALVTAVVDWASDRNIGFSHVISLGDMADVDFGDLLDYLAGDTRSRAILLYMEAATNAPKFMSAARRAARVKPVIVIKSGRHASAARAAASHTGRLAGRDDAYEAAFRRAGLLRVTALSELFEAAEMLARQARIAGERLVILTNGGGAGVLAADHLADAGGSLAELDPDIRLKLDQLLPANWSRGNPVDIIGDAPPQRYGQALTTLLSDPGCDAVLAINCPTALASSTAVAEAVLSAHAAARPRKPLVTTWLGQSAAVKARDLFAQHRIASFETPRAAVRGFMQLVRYARAQDELMRTPPARASKFDPDPARAESILGGVLRAGRTMLSEVESKSLLSAYGIPANPTRTATTPAEAAQAAAELLGGGTNVVLKILSKDITHKSDVGGVHLDLTSPEAVKQAAIAMLALVRQIAPSADIAGFTVAAMVRRRHAHELLAGMTVDPTFGPLIMFGAGGTAVEVIADTALAIPPLDLMLARRLIERTRVARLLAGYRDRKPADIDAVAETLVQLSTLVCRHPEIREIDINPLLADDKGAIALDARIRVADPASEPRPPLVIRPYPTEWERRETLKRLGKIVLRPIRPEDEWLYERFFARISQADLRMRLFAPVKELSHKFLARLTQIDYAREIAFVALSPEDGELLGVSRFTADPDYDTAEYAILVRTDIKGNGLGWRLMAQLIDYGRATGLRVLYGQVLAENTAMLHMCRQLGFSVALEPGDPTSRRVTLTLN